MTALRNKGPGGGWSRQRELHLLEWQREPCSKCSLNLEEEETGREAEEEGKAQLGKSLEAMHLAFTLQKPESKYKI